MEAYQTERKLLTSDVDLHRRLRLSRLLTLLQEAAIAHTEQLGAGREKTLDRGLLWVVTLQQVNVNRLPLYDEAVRLTSVPGEMQHVFFPRHTRLTDADGRVLLTAAAWWALMDAETRTMVFPDEAGIRIPGQTPDWETFIPRPPKLPAEGRTRTFTVPYSYADLNGHMNNTRYLDLAEDGMPAPLRDAAIREIRTEYTGEAKPGAALTLTDRAENDTYLLTGAADKRLFRLSLRYDLTE